MRILLDTGSSSSEWNTLCEKLYTKKQGTFKFKLPEFI
jgi:hypothetical protein